MIHVKFLSQALTGLPVRMTVTQGKVSRNLSIDAFGKRAADNATPPPPDSGTEIVLPPPPPPVASAAKLIIGARRGQQQIAPEGIAFFAEISGFDAQRPAGSTVYDPALHDIAYTWSFGDPGNYAAPENMLAPWRDANKGYGPFPSHVFTKPGTYTVTCTAVERSSGKSASASTTVTVQDPQTVFTPATTVVCAAGGNFDGAPAHDAANRTTTFAAAISRLKALKLAGQPARLLFRGGDVFDMTAQTYAGNQFHNLYVSSFGSGRATIRARAGGAVFQVWDSLPVSGGSISRLAFVGPWDSTTETRDPALASGNTFGVDVSGGFCTVHDCTGSGLWTAFTTGSVPGLTAIFSDCRATNWEDYGLYVVAEKSVEPNGVLTSYVGVLGCRLDQDRNALQGANGKSTTDRGNRHGAMRCHAPGYLYVDALDGFARNGWTAVGGVPGDQNVIRDHRNEPRSRGFFSRIMGEGGWQAYSNGSATGEGHEPCNTVIDKAYFLGSARSVGSLGITASAFTGRNILVHRPNVGTGADTPNGAIALGDSQVVNFLPTAKPEPVRLYNVTIVNELDNTQQARNKSGNTSWTPITVNQDRYDTGMTQVANIVVHRPAFAGGETADMPLDATRLGLVPRYLGYRWKNHAASSLGDNLVMDTSFATPANPWSLWRPQAGSKAIGSAAGLVAHDDLLGNVRPAKASRGAVEPA